MYQIYISYIDCYHVLYITKKQNLAALKSANTYCNLDHNKICACTVRALTDLN